MREPTPHSQIGPSLAKPDSWGSVQIMMAGQEAHEQSVKRHSGRVWKKHSYVRRKVS